MVMLPIPWSLRKGKAPYTSFPLLILKTEFGNYQIIDFVYVLLRHDRLTNYHISYSLPFGNCPVGKV